MYIISRGMKTRWMSKHLISYLRFLGNLPCHQGWCRIDNKMLIQVNTSWQINSWCWRIFCNSKEEPELSVQWCQDILVLMPALRKQLAPLIQAVLVARSFTLLCTEISENESLYNMREANSRIRSCLLVSNWWEIEQYYWNGTAQSC